VTRGYTRAKYDQIGNTGITDHDDWAACAHGPLVLDGDEGQPQRL
jgi:hypothetical protein